MRLMLVAVVALAGCGDPKPLPMAATAESSRATLAAALDAWKAGKTREDLASGSPAIIFQDDDFYKKTKLADYKIEGEGQPRGTGYSYVVALNLDGKIKRVYYSVVSEPKQAVTREDRSP
jgi:hypothetical protein